MSHPTILRRQDAVLVVIDIQEKLLPHIHGQEELLANCLKLIRGCRAMGVPVLATEQYPRGLGRTHEQVRPHLVGATVVEKITFSCAGEESFMEALEELEREQVVICGIESHVCVLQTALDLLHEGFEVQVAADCVGSRNPAHVPVALNRVSGVPGGAGAVVTVAETVLFELLGEAGTDEFKEIVRLVK